MIAATKAVFRSNWPYMAGLLLLMTAARWFFHWHDFAMLLVMFFVTDLIAKYATQRRLLSDMVASNGTDEVTLIIRYLFKAFVLFSLTLTFGSIFYEAAAAFPLSARISEMISYDAALLVGGIFWFFAWVITGSWLPATIAEVESGFWMSVRRGFGSFLPVASRMAALYISGFAVVEFAYLIVDAVTSGQIKVFIDSVLTKSFYILMSVGGSIIFAIEFRRSVERDDFDFNGCGAAARPVGAPVDEPCFGSCGQGRPMFGARRP